MVIRTVKIHGKRRFMLDGRIAGQRFRETFPTREAAELRRKEIEEEIRGAGESWQALSGPERRLLADLHHAATREGVTLSTVWHEWRAFRAGQGTANDAGPSLREAVQQYLDTKERAKLSPRTLVKLRHTLAWLVQLDPDLQTGQITHLHALQVLEARPAPSWNTIAATLSGFFAWTVRQGWRTDNPLDRVERHRAATAAPEILRIAEVRKCLAWLSEKRPEALAWFVLTTFCGLRPEEALLTPWSSIRLDEGLVIVDGQTSKTRRRRVVYPRPNALAWLARARELGSIQPLNAGRCRRIKRQLAEHLHWGEWKQDVTRHSAASYWLALTQDASAVATALGHSVGVLHNRYKALVLREKAVEFFAILP